MRSVASINSFLEFGYYLDYSSEINLPQISIDEMIKNLTYNQQINIGKELFLKSIERKFQNNCEIVVPLSGGLDSRAILSGLGKFKNYSEIETYTFGSKGTWDYEFGCYVAKKLGTKHKSFDISKELYTLDSLSLTSKYFNHQTVLFFHPPTLKILEICEGKQVWSGFMGDPSVGSHLRKEPSISHIQARERFINSNRIYRGEKICDPEVSINDLVTEPPSTFSGISLDEQYDLHHRQLKYIAPHVVPNSLQFITPFLDSDWLNFGFSIPSEVRYGQSFYLDFLINTFPKEFSLPTKTNYGLGLDVTNSQLNNKKFITKLKHKINNILPVFKPNHVNYLDFKNQIKTRSDLKKIIPTLLASLDDRKFLHWLNCQELYKQHTPNRDLSTQILLLCSLEIHLREAQNG